VNHSVLTRVCLAVAAAACLSVGIAGCASEEGDGFPGGGGDTGEGASANEGGGGGGTSSCETDCSLVETPDCLVSVCNEGEHAGEIGSCVVVNASTGTECDDGLFCSVDDFCEEGVCQGGGVNDCGTNPAPCDKVSCN